MEHEEVKQLESAARRPIGGDVLHPDRCAKLMILGVAFAIPPRRVRIGPVFAGGKTARAIIDEKGLAQISDASALEAVADQVIRDNPQAVADFKAGKAQAVKFMVGQLMRLSKGRANPGMATEIITRKLGGM